MMFHYETTSGERISGDVLTEGVLIPYAALDGWDDAALANFGIRRIDDQQGPQLPDAPEAVPEVITNFQARAALIAFGLFDAVDGWARSLGTSHPGWQAWEYANDFYRHGALLTSLAAQFGLSEKTLDDLFIAGSKIEA